MITRIAHSVTPLLCTGAVAAQCATDRQQQFLIYFPKAGLCDLLPISASVYSLLIMPEPIFAKLGMYIMSPTTTWTAYFVSPSHQSACLYVYVARQRLGNNFIFRQRIHTQRQMDYWKRCFLCGPFRIKRESMSLSTVHLDTGFTGFPLSLSKLWDGFQVPSCHCVLFVQPSKLNVHKN
jgi:hypothetical protein